eukprot:190250_1
MANELNDNNNDVAFILSNGYLINLILIAGITCGDINGDKYRENTTALAGERKERISEDKLVDDELIDGENATALAGERKERIPEDKLVDDELIDGENATALAGERKERISEDKLVDDELIDGENATALA